MRKKIKPLSRYRPSAEQREQARCVRVSIEFEDGEPMLVVNAEALAEDIAGYSGTIMVQIETFWLNHSSGESRLRFLKEKVCRYGADLDPQILEQVESFSLYRYMVPDPPSVT